MSKSVGDYVLKEKIGKGSYADVYKGLHKITGSAFAIKTISKENLSDAKLLMGLESEIKIMREFAHENIVRLHEYFSSEKNFYLVLELCEGGDLSKYIKKKKRIGERVAHSFLLQLSDGLSFLQEKNFIHRDLKPANVLLSECSENAVLKLADFGFARHLTAASLAQTRCGTPLYMAPEILESRDYDAKADIWSVGCIFYEMLVGIYPFRGSSESDLLNNIKTKELTIPKDIEVSRASIDVLIKLLERQPIRRASIEQLSAIAVQLVKTTGGTLRDAHLFSVGASEVDAAANKTLSDSPTATLNLNANSSQIPMNFNATSAKAVGVKEIRTSVGESSVPALHRRSEDVTFEGGPRSRNSSDDVIRSNFGIASLPVAPPSAVSAIGKAIAFVFSPPQEHRNLNGRATAGQGRSVSVDSGKGIFTEYGHSRPPMTSVATAVSEGLLANDYIGRASAAKEKEPLANRAAPNTDEEGFVMIESSTVELQRSRDKTQGMLNGDGTLVAGANHVEELSSVYYRVVLHVVSLADQFVSEQFQPEMKRTGTLNAAAHVNGSLPVNLALTALSLYFLALTVLKSWVSTCTAQVDDISRISTNDFASRMRKNCGNLFSEVLQRAESCQTHIDVQLRGSEMGSCKFRKPSATAIMVQIALARESDAGLEELRNIVWAFKLYSSALEVLDSLRFIVVALHGAFADELVGLQIEEHSNRISRKIDRCQLKMNEIGEIW